MYLQIGRWIALAQRRYGFATLQGLWDSCPDFFMYVAVAFMKLAGKAWIGFEDEE